MRLRITAIALTVTASIGVTAAPAVGAVPGSLDQSFGSGGFATARIGTQTVAVQSQVQPDGSIVTAGGATVNGQNVMLAVRMRPGGALDQSFGTDGYTLVAIGKSAGANAVVLQPNGDIVIAGTGRDLVTGTLALAVVRLLPNGSLDRMFGSGGVVTVPVGAAAIANAVQVQPDGYIVVAGTASSDHNRFVAARLTPSGTLDTSFGSNGIELLAPTAAGWGMVLQPDGSIVIGGEEAYKGSWAFMAARLTASGAPDRRFGNGGIVTIPIGTLAVGLAIALQRDGKILLTGNADTGTKVVAIVRLMPDGALDPRFGSKGVATFGGQNSQAIAVQPNGDIVLAGPGATAARLTPSGVLDQSFGKRGLSIVALGTNDAANGVAIDPLNGDIVLSGVATISGTVIMTVISLLE